MGQARGYLDFRLSSTRSTLNNEKTEKSDVNFTDIRTGYLKTSLLLPSKCGIQFGRDGKHALPNDAVYGRGLPSCTTAGLSEGSQILQREL